MSLKPAFPAPPGVTQVVTADPRDNPDSIASDVIKISLPMSIAATLIVLLRLYARLHIVRSFGKDDLYIVIGMTFSWLFAIQGITNIANGYGVHVWDLTAPQLVAFLKNDLLGQNAYFIATIFVKVSILQFYFRLNPNRKFRLTAYAIMGVVVAYNVISVIIATLGCTPIPSGWDITIPGQCVNKKAFYYVQAILNILTDFATLFLPIKLCWELHAPRRQKILLFLLFVVGSFASLISIIRLVTMVPSLSSMDFTRFKVGVAGWALVEINTGIICACLPCLKPILNRHCPRLIGSKGSQSGPSNFNSDNYGLSNMSHKGAKGTKNSYRLESNENSGWGPAHGHGAAVMADQKEGSESVRHILRGEHQDGIMKSTEVDVTYADETQYRV